MHTIVLEGGKEVVISDGIYESLLRGDGTFGIVEDGEKLRVNVLLCDGRPLPRSSSRSASFSANDRYGRHEPGPCHIADSAADDKRYAAYRESVAALVNPPWRTAAKDAPQRPPARQSPPPRPPSPPQDDQHKPPVGDVQPVADWQAKRDAAYNMMVAGLTGGR